MRPGQSSTKQKVMAQRNGFDQLENQLGSSTSKNSNVQNPSQKELDSLISLYNQKKLQQVFEKTPKINKKIY